VAGFAALEARAARAARGSRALRRRVRHLRAASLVFSVAIEGRDPDERATPLCAEIDRSDVSARRVFQTRRLPFSQTLARPSSDADAKAEPKSGVRDDSSNREV
jgi:hypothetical protein